MNTLLGWIRTGIQRLWTLTKGASAAPTPEPVREEVTSTAVDVLQMVTRPIRVLAGFIKVALTFLFGVVGMLVLGVLFIPAWLLNFVLVKPIWWLCRKLASIDGFGKDVLEHGIA